MSRDIPQAIYDIPQAIYSYVMNFQVFISYSFFMHLNNFVYVFVTNAVY